MKRVLIAGAVVVAVLAVGVYRAKLGAEETQGKIDGLNAEVKKVNEQISVLKAEEAYLSRPERIGPIARGMGLQPAAPEQYTAAEMMSRRLGEERIALPVAPEAVPAPAKPARPQPVPAAATAPPPKAGTP
jgi:cell division protein FtsL